MTATRDNEQVLLVLDAQRAYTDPRSRLACLDAEATIERINRVIAAFQSKKRPVIYVRHEYKADGSDVGRMKDPDSDPDDKTFRAGTVSAAYAPELKRLRNASEVVKNRYSAFAGTGLKHELDLVDAEHLVITGFMTSFCCESTARDAHDLDYQVTFLPDATGSPALSKKLDQDKIRALVGAFLAAGFAHVEQTDDFLADSPTLKA